MGTAQYGKNHPPKKLMGICRKMSQPNEGPIASWIGKLLVTEFD